MWLSQESAWWHEVDSVDSEDDHRSIENVYELFSSILEKGNTGARSKGKIERLTEEDLVTDYRSIPTIREFDRSVNCSASLLEGYSVLGKMEGKRTG